jgi:hypothetical protein
MIQLKNFKPTDLQSLNAIDSKCCVSLHIPTSKYGRETQQGAIHLKNLLTKTSKELEGHSLGSDSISKLLDPIHALVDNTDFWQHQNQGLSIFASEGFLEAFSLPITVPARQFVGEAFDVVPILPMLTNDGQFYILALSENRVRLIEATRYEFSEVVVDDMPTSMSSTLPEDEPEKQQQRHGGATGSPTYFGSGTGGGSEDHKVDLKRFFDRVDAALAPYFKKHPAPVILAGVEYLLPIYRTANTVATILDGDIHGNKDRTSDEELHEEAWKIIAPHFKQDQSAAKDAFHHLLSVGTASLDANEIGTAADSGRVATLFVAVDAKNSASLNHTVIETLSKGGEIFAMDQEAMPTDKPLAASFRY